MKLSTDLIRTDGGTQMRAVVRDDVIIEYAERMSFGSVFPPIIVFHDGSDFWLVDGFHRLATHELALPNCPIQAEVQRGTIGCSVVQLWSQRDSRPAANQRRQSTGGEVCLEAPECDDKEQPRYC